MLKCNSIHKKIFYLFITFYIINIYIITFFYLKDIKDIIRLLKMNYILKCKFKIEM